MNLFNTFRDTVVQELEKLADAGKLPAGLDFSRVAVEPPRDPSHGDLATNAAMVLTKPAGLAPRAIAEPLAEALGALDRVEAVEVAGPGFINLRLDPGYWQERLAEMLRAGPAWTRPGASLRRTWAAPAGTTTRQRPRLRRSHASGVSAARSGASAPVRRCSSINAGA